MQDTHYPSYDYQEFLQTKQDFNNIFYNHYSQHSFQPLHLSQQSYTNDHSCASLNYPGIPVELVSTTDADWMQDDDIENNMQLSNCLPLTKQAPSLKSMLNPNA